MKPHNVSSQKTESHNPSRRDFVLKAAYIAPAVVTLSVLPAHQAVGSVRNGGSDPQPPPPA